MSTVNPSPETHAAVSAAANFLLSLNAGLGGNNAKADVFSKFLLQTDSGKQNNPQSSQTQPVVQQTQQQQTTQTSHASSDTPSSADNTETKLPPLPALKSLVSAWRHILDRLQGHNNGHDISAAKSQAPDANKGNGNPVPAKAASDENGDQTDPSTPTADQTSSVVSAATDANDVSSTENDGGDDQKTISDILKELQALALLIEQQLQNLQNPQTAAAGNTVSGTTVAATGNIDPTQATDPAQSAANPLLALDASLINAATGTPAADATAATDPTVSAAPSDPTHTTDATQQPTLTQALTDLLTLVQLAAKQLQGAQITADASTTPSTDGTAAVDANTQAASVWPSDAQLKADLKVLLDNLRASVAANKTQSTPSQATTDAAQAVVADATDTAISNLPPEAPTVARNDWMQKNDLAGMFKTDVNQNATQQVKSDADANNNFAASTAVNSLATGNGGKEGGASADMDSNGQQSNQSGRSIPGALANNTLDNSDLASTTSGVSAPQTNTYNFASQLSATRAVNGGLTGLPDAVEQVILHLNRNVKTGNDQMSLQLNPADLGRVDIKLNISPDGKVQGTVVADNPATLHLLLKDVRGLERALQEAGLRADSGSLQFSLGNQSGNPGQTANNYPSDGSGRNNYNDPSLQDTVSDLSDISSDTTETYYLTPSRVNLRV